jgi:hypothetical protein
MLNKNCLIAFISLFLLLLLSCDVPVQNQPKQEREVEESTLPKAILFEEKKVKISRHAACRMDCRHIDAGEVQEIINLNKINQRKSNPKQEGKRCPSIAFEGFTKRDRQHLRIVVGDCDKRPILITVIDLKNNYRCSCN